MLSTMNSPYLLVSTCSYPPYLLYVLKLAPGDVSSESRFRVVIVNETRQRELQKAAELVRCSAFVGAGRRVIQRSTASGALSGRSITDGQCYAAGDRPTGDVSGSQGHLNVGRWWFQYDDGRLHHAEPDGAPFRGQKLIIREGPLLARSGHSAKRRCRISARTGSRHSDFDQRFAG